MVSEAINGVTSHGQSANILESGRERFLPVRGLRRYFCRTNGTMSVEGKRARFWPGNNQTALNPYTVLSFINGTVQMFFSHYRHEVSLSQK